MIKSIIIFAQDKLDSDVTNLPQVSADSGSLDKLFAAVFGVFAAVAVLIIVLSAIDFATSNGNPEKVSRAKNTIIYALVGLAMALSAEAIIYTVLNKL